LINDDSLKKLSWSEFVAGVDVDAKPELVRYLKEKRLYVNELEPVEMGVES
jgi:hypothetical protein